MGLRSLSAALAAAALSLALPFGLNAQKRVPSAPRSTPPAPRPSGINPGSRVQPNHVPAQRTPIEEFETMPPAEQQKALGRLPAGQRKELQERLDQFNQLPAEQQRALVSFYNRLHQLPEQKQDGVRKAWNKFVDQPKERQQVIREELRDIAGLSADERKSEMTSPAFKSRFSKKEQDIVRDMEPLLPER